MLARIGQALQRLASRIVPDPFLLALGLTFVVGIGAWARLGASGTEDAAWQVADGWFDGFSGSGGLAFALQMCLILITGHALALSPPVQRVVRAIARLPHNAAAASALVAFVACVAGVVHWGLGAIVGALLAREIGRFAREDGILVHYPLLGAAAYSGLAVWHGGLSGSAPLKVAEEGHFLVDTVGVVPLSDTLMSPLNLAITGALIVLIPITYHLLTPHAVDDLVLPGVLDGDDLLLPAGGEDASGVVAALQRSPLVGQQLGGAGLIALIWGLVSGRYAFDINTVNALFLFFGIVLHGSVARYVAAVADGARGAGAIILQFPFYFGILGMMRAGGLDGWLSELLVDLSSATTFPVVAFLSAGLVNFFVPSGGGQWAVQGQILLSAGAELGVAPQTTIMAFSYGDAWTNMLQPFWALPLLGIMGLRARDIIGYTAVIFVLIAVVVPVGLLVIG